MNIFQALATYAKKDFTTFGMSNNWLGSVNGFGELTPIYQDIVIASDTWKMSHNVMVKLPPLIAPAFTRVKAVINSFYVSYASVWKHWNSFISDKPDDVFLNRSLLRGYRGKFVEPYAPMKLIAYICKIAKGNFYGDLDSTSEEYGTISDGDGNTYVAIRPIYNVNKTALNKGYSDSYKTITWTLEKGLRRAVLSVRHDDAVLEQWVNSSTPPTSSCDYFSDYDSEILQVFPYSDIPQLSEAVTLGFYDSMSFLIYLCQSCVRNLEANGVPCDLLASTDLDYYEDDKFNLLPDICRSSIWQNFYRDEQNQSPEFDYSEVNGCICPVANVNESGWQIRLNGLPLNTSSAVPLWFRVNSISRAFSLLTGYNLRLTVVTDFNNIQTDNISVLPSHYNGLLLTKYRNFEKDYFTSACVDPMMGAVSVSTPSTIEALRTASKLEEFLERSASARDFYNFMKYNFGTNPESTRYKKPLLLGTKIIPIQISEQLQTSESANTPLGERAGVADGYGNGGTCDHYFNEHGHIFSFLSFVLDSQYMQGMPHQFFHHLQLDYPFPDFANLGAESILTSEVYYSNYDCLNFDPYAGFSRVTTIKADGDTGNIISESQSPSQFYSVDSPGRVVNFVENGLGVKFGDRGVFQSAGTLGYGAAVNSDIPAVFSKGESKVFGYVPRYSRWKWKNDVVCGQMRDELEYWHTFRQFSQVPYIGHNFVSYEDAGFVSDLNRIFAVENDNADKFYLDIFNNCSVRRCLPLVANPQIN